MGDLDFDSVRKALLNQLDNEILNLKHWLESKTDEQLTTDPEVESQAAEWIFNTHEGLKKLSAVLSFIDCWEENGDIPQLSRSCFQQ